MQNVALEFPFVINSVKKIKTLRKTSFSSTPPLRPVLFLTHAHVRKNLSIPFYFSFPSKRAKQIIANVSNFAPLEEDYEQHPLFYVIERRKCTQTKDPQKVRFSALILRPKKEVAKMQFICLVLSLIVEAISSNDARI